MAFALASYQERGGVSIWSKTAAFITDRRDGRAMKHKNSHLLVGYWSRLRKGRDLPDQADIEPRAIKRLLSHVFILDAQNPARPIYRLAGTGLCERFGFEMKGTGFLSHWEGQSSIALASLLKQALKLRQPLCLSSVGATADCGMVEIETTLVPIASDDGEPTRFIGLFQMLSDVGQLAGRPIAFQRLAASKLVREDEPLSAFDAPPPPPPFPPSEASRSRTPHLRLVVNQDKPMTVHFEAERMLGKVLDAFGLAGTAKIEF